MDSAEAGRSEVTKSKCLQIIMPSSTSRFVNWKEAAQVNTSNCAKLTEWFHVVSRLIELVSIYLKSNNCTGNWTNRCHNSLGLKYHEMNIKPFWIKYKISWEAWHFLQRRVSRIYMFMPWIIHLCDRGGFGCCTERVQVHVQQAAHCGTVKLITTGIGGLIG